MRLTLVIAVTLILSESAAFLVANPGTSVSLTLAAGLFFWLVNPFCGSLTVLGYMLAYESK